MPCVIPQWLYCWEVILCHHYLFHYILTLILLTLPLHTSRHLQDSRGVPCVVPQWLYCWEDILAAREPGAPDAHLRRSRQVFQQAERGRGGSNALLGEWRGRAGGRVTGGRRGMIWSLAASG